MWLFQYFLKNSKNYTYKQQDDHKDVPFLIPLQPNLESFSAVFDLFNSIAYVCCSLLSSLPQGIWDLAPRIQITAYFTIT